MPETLNGSVVEYTLTRPSVSYTFPEFFPGPNCCEVSYTYQVNDRKGWLVVKNWDSLKRTFTFEYNETLNYNTHQDSQDYQFTVIASTGLNNKVEAKAVFFLRVQNPCSEKAEIPLIEEPPWCQSSPPAELPEWMRNLSTISIYGD